VAAPNLLSGLILDSFTLMVFKASSRSLLRWSPYKRVKQINISLWATTARLLYPISERWFSKRAGNTDYGPWSATLQIWIWYRQISSIRGNMNHFVGRHPSGLMSFKDWRSRSRCHVGRYHWRAAKMVCLNLDHPDIVDFIEWSLVRNLPP
jgi:hypothetical protein